MLLFDLLIALMQSRTEKDDICWHHFLTHKFVNKTQRHLNFFTWGRVSPPTRRGQANIIWLRTLVSDTEVLIFIIPALLAQSCGSPNWNQFREPLTADCAVKFCPYEQIPEIWISQLKVSLGSGITAHKHCENLVPLHWLSNPHIYLLLLPPWCGAVKDMYLSHHNILCSD